MRRRTLIAALASGALIAIAKFFPYPNQENNTTSTASQNSSTPEQADNPIVAENALPGTTSWMIPPAQSATTQIQAYAGARSVAPGQSIKFYVSTQKAGTPYTIAIYRIGWYQGQGARLMHSESHLKGQAQGYYDAKKFEVIDCPTLYFDPQTRLMEARWKPSYELKIPSDWVTGVYLVKLTDEQGMQTYTNFNVTGNEKADYAVVTADTTYAAYNNWGGYCLYDETSKDNRRANKVSFDRPSTQYEGSDQVLIFEANPIRWFESKGYNLSYLSSIDLQTKPDVLLRHKAYISLGHDEYWSQEMRAGVEKMRDSGRGLAFLEANACYWQIRFEPGTTGVPNQTVVCYKPLTERNDLTLDPMYGVNNTVVTSQWRDPVVNNPENSLIGIMYSDYNSSLRGTAWKFTHTNGTDILKDTNLKAGQSFDYGLVGYEWDKVFDNGHTPKNLVVLATSSTVSAEGKQDTSNTAYYIAPSGAMVFATGSIYWTGALDNYRYLPEHRTEKNSQVVPEIQTLMANVMDNLVKRHKP